MLGTSVYGAVIFLWRQTAQDVHLPSAPGVDVSVATAGGQHGRYRLGHDHHVAP